MWSEAFHTLSHTSRSYWLHHVSTHTLIEITDVKQTCPHSHEPPMHLYNRSTQECTHTWTGKKTYYTKWHVKMATFSTFCSHFLWHILPIKSKLSSTHGSVALRADDIRSYLTKLGQRYERKEENICELKKSFWFKSVLMPELDQKKKKQLSLWMKKLVRKVTVDTYSRRWDGKKPEK